jgi:hypothetical protein
MPTYLITYHGGPGLPDDPAVAQQMVAAFKAWVSEVGPAMRDLGAPLAAARTVSASGIVDGQGQATIGRLRLAASTRQWSSSATTRTSRAGERSR